MHELAHALGLGYEQYGREQAEVLVDCVTYIVCSSVGLDVGGESIPYIAGWGEDGALDAIRDYAADDRHDRPAHRRRARPTRHQLDASRRRSKRPEPPRAPARVRSGLRAPQIVGRTDRLTARQAAACRCSPLGSPADGAHTAPDRKRSRP